MKQTFHITRALILAAMLGLIVVAGLAMRAQDADRENLENASQENLYWNMAQVEVELARFIAALAAYQAGAGDTDARLVNQRFNILWSRADVFGAGKIGARMRALDKDARIEEFRRLLVKYDQPITKIDDQPRAVLIQAIADFQARASGLRALLGVVVRAEEARHAVIRKKLHESGQLSFGTSVGAILLALLLVAIMLSETRRHRLHAEHSATLARAAAAAARSKSRFLTMMSHELRTPMNGVIGMLELVRQTPLNEPQLRLIDQAKRSGTQMIGLLSDILDLSDLQDETTEPLRAPFRVADLVAGLERGLQAEIQRGGVALSITSAPDLPVKLNGDAPRLEKIINYFARSLIEFVGMRELDLRVSWTNGLLCVEIETPARDADGPGWRPQDTLDRGDDQTGGFTSDALGPMIARGLAAVIGGEIRSEERADGRVAIIIETPMEEVPVPAPRVRLITETPTLELMLQGMARRLGWRLWAPEEAGAAPDAILVEAAHGDDRAQAAQLRQSFPGSWLVAIGAPRDGAGFDAVCPIPPTPDQLEAAIAHAPARDQAAIS